jgi:3-oxoacyl-[acyl-carrier protein] reductase
MRLSGKTAIITGAASGYGAGIAHRFSAEGANVVVADIDEAKGVAVAGALASAIFVPTDVSKATDIAALLERAKQAYGRVDIVVNNAGATHRKKPLCEISEAEFDRVFSVNVRSLMHSAKVMVPHFRAHGGGVFVNVASIVAFRPVPGLAWYCGSKAAVLNISKAMAVELGPDNIRVNCVNPAVGDTGMLADFMGEPDTPALRQRYKAAIPLGRFTDPSDVAAACVFLASDDAQFVTGTSIEVDGGRSV